MRYEIKDITVPDTIKRSMELQAESERIKRSKILASEGEMTSGINSAQGVKEGTILEGQGEAEKITNEARAIVDSLDSIAQSLTSGTEGAPLREEAIRLRLTERYLAALKNVLGETQVIMMPANGASGENNPMSPQNMAAAMTMYNKLVGSGGPGSANPAVISELLNKPSESEQSTQRAPSFNEARKRVQFHDDNRLF